MLRAKNRFDSSIQRIKKLDSLYIHLVEQLKFSEIDIADILRSEYVYVISTLDKFIHDVVRQGMLDTFNGNRTPTNAYRNFGISLEQLENIRIASIPPPEQIFINTISNSHKYLSFQEPDKISVALSLIWNESHKWQKIADCMGEPANDVKVKLKNIVIRRNQIVHESDIDLATGIQQDILHHDIQESLIFVEILVNCIYDLIE